MIFNCHARSTSSLLLLSLSHHISESAHCASSSAHLWMKVVAVWWPFIFMWKEFLVSLQFLTSSPAPIDYWQYKYRGQGLTGQRTLCSSGSANIVAGVWGTYFDPETVYWIIKQMESVKWNQLSSPFCFLQKIGVMEKLSFLTLLKRERMCKVRQLSPYLATLLLTQIFGRRRACTLTRICTYYLYMPIQYF